MLEFLFQCFAVSMAIAVGIVVVYGGCTALSRIFEGRAPSHTVKVRNFIGDGSSVAVRLSDGQIIRDCRFRGFADFGTHKSIPYEFKSWLVLEHGSERLLIKPQFVRIITETAAIDD